MPLYTAHPWITLIRRHPEKPVKGLLRFSQSWFLLGLVAAWQGLAPEVREKIMELVRSREA
jgi:hypothetical protein